MYYTFCTHNWRSENALQEMEKWMVSEQLIRDRILEAAVVFFAESLFKVRFIEYLNVQDISYNYLSLFKNRMGVLFEVASAPLESYIKRH